MIYECQKTKGHFRLNSSAPTGDHLPQNQKTSERIQISTGGLNLTTLWQHIDMIPSQKVEVALLGLPKLPEMNRIQSN